MSNLNTEKGAACAAALEELFRQYPLAEPYERSRIWRNDAIRHALNGDIKAAISWAWSTGVPIDVLFALEVLLNE